MEEELCLKNTTEYLQLESKYKALIVYINEYHILTLDTALKFFDKIDALKEENEDLIKKIKKLENDLKK